MRKILRAVANWLQKYGDENERLKAERDSLRDVLWEVNAQYAKFKLIAPKTMFEMRESLGHLGYVDFESLKTKLPLDLIDTVPRADYEAIRISHDRHLLMVATLQHELTTVKWQTQKHEGEADAK